MKKFPIFLASLMLTLSMNGITPQKANAADISFTHKEWTGQSGAEDIFAVNREAASVNPVPFHDDASAVNAVWDYNAREQSDYLQMLTGENEDWELNVVQNEEKAAPYRWGGFMNADYKGKDGDGWKTVQLPKSWTCLGFDFPIYDNVVMPWQVDIKYTIHPDGRVDVDFNVDATRSGLGNFIRVGSMMTLPEGSEQLSWYGNLTESFNDRKSGGRQGVWESTVSEQFFPYMKADDTGNLTDVKWISVKNSSNSSGLLIAANGTVEASALHFYPEDLQKADHVYKLSPRKETILSVDYGSMGTGSATCGQGTLEKYRLPSGRTYKWSYSIIPVSSEADGKALSTTAAKLRSDGISVQDKSSNALTIPVKSPAVFKSTSEGNAVSGSLSIPSGNSIGKSLEGKNSFTVEAEFVPTGNPGFNMIASKGDHAFGLRTENGMLYFFIHAGGEWRTVSYKTGTDEASGWIGKKHQLAGIYDAENNMIKIYCDGKMVAEKSTGTSAGITSSSYDLTMGACPETGRTSMADFYEFRVYSKALSESELASQRTASPAYAPDSPYVKLWLDFDNIAENEAIDDIPDDIPQVDPKQNILYGDANCDGEISMDDAVIIMQSMANPSKYGMNGSDSGHLTKQGSLNGDVYANGDGITSMDALEIQKYLLELIDSLEP